MKNLNNNKMVFLNTEKTTKKKQKTNEHTVYEEYTHTTSYQNSSG